MANPLQNGMATPEPPSQNAIQSGNQIVSGNPAPSHAQTVAALRHFDMVRKELLTLTKKPDFGKSDMKSEIIDGMTRLVADRIIPPATAVQQLATVPERPFEQKKWIEQHILQIQQAEQAILFHHAMSFAGEGEQEAPKPENHMQDMNEMMAAHYNGQNNA